MDFIPGFIQGLVRVTISHPFEVIKINSQYYQEKPKYIIKHFINNPFKIYRGVKYNYLIVGIERSIQYKYYEDFKKKYNTYLSGLMISTPLLLITMPVNTIINNLIINNKIIKTGYYKGILPEYCRSVLASTIYLGTYGYLRKDDLSMNNIMYASIISSYLSWSITYPLDTIRTLYQTNKIKDVKISKLWSGISMIYIRTLPSSVCGMLVYEWTREIIYS